MLMYDGSSKCHVLTVDESRTRLVYPPVHVTAWEPIIGFTS